MFIKLKNGTVHETRYIVFDHDSELDATLIIYLLAETSTRMSKLSSEIDTVTNVHPGA